MPSKRVLQGKICGFVKHDGDLCLMKPSYEGAPCTKHYDANALSRTDHQSTGLTSKRSTSISWLIQNLPKPEQAKARAIADLPMDNAEDQIVFTRYRMASLQERYNLNLVRQTDYDRGMDAFQRTLLGQMEAQQRLEGQRLLLNKMGDSAFEEDLYDPVSGDLEQE